MLENAKNRSNWPKVDSYAAIPLCNILRLAQMRGKKVLSMNKQQSTTTATPECFQHIEALQRLAQAAPETALKQLTGGPTTITAIAEVLTSASGQPMGRSFEELFPLEDVSAWRDANDSPLPALTRTENSVWNAALEAKRGDPLYTAQGQQYYLRSNVLAKAISVIFNTLRQMPPSELTSRLPAEDAQCLQRLQQILTGEVPVRERNATAFKTAAKGSQGFQAHSAQYTPMIPRPYAVTI